MNSWKSGNKYNAKKTVIDGITFDSKKEAARYSELLMLQKAGHIQGLDLQPEYEIAPSFRYNGKHHRARKYRADFRYIEDGQTVVEDVKSPATRKISLYRLKRHLFLSLYGDALDFRET